MRDQNLELEDLRAKMLDTSTKQLVLEQKTRIGKL